MVPAQINHETPSENSGKPTEKMVGPNHITATRPPVDRKLPVKNLELGPRKGILYREEM